MKANRNTPLGKIQKTSVWVGLYFFLALMLPTLAQTRRSSQVQANDERIYLLHTDTQHYNEYKYPFEILNGNVQFRHKAVLMYCDSAHYYRANNSFEAFGHVRMLQGDTLSLTGDRLFYDGNSQIAQVRRNVKMKHRATTLLTDSLNYDRVYDMGYFFEGGKLLDGENVLTSEWGEYSPKTRLANFYYNVKLDNKDFTLTSDTLHYDTQQKWANVEGPSNIVSGKTTIYTERGFYNTTNKSAKLYHRSVVANEKYRIVGDSLFYDELKGTTHGYQNVVCDDYASKNQLLGNLCFYDEQQGYSFATDSALLKDYSGTDTLFLHADTFKVFSYNLKTDSLYRVAHGYSHARGFRQDMQMVCDSLTYYTNWKRLSLYKNPIVWTENQQLLGEEIYAFMNDSTIDSTHVVNQASLVERLDSIHYNQVASKEMRSYFHEGALQESRAISNVYVVYYPFDSDSLMIGLNYAETSLMRMFFKDRKVKKIWTPQVSATLYPLPLIPSDKLYLSNFAWFDYIRPRDKNDVFEWRGKKEGTELKPTIRREMPTLKLTP